MEQILFEEALAGGNPRTLGRAEEIVVVVLDEPYRLPELFECVFHPDEIVRMRAGDALEKVCRLRPELLEPFIPRLLSDVPKVEQHSIQWHLAQMLSEVTLHGRDRARAIRVLKRNLGRYTDWIVVNCTLESLASFARASAPLRKEFVEILRRYQKSELKSVRSRATKLLKEFDSTVE